MPTYTIASANLGDGESARKNLLLDRLYGADVIALQEASDRLPLLYQWAKRNGYRLITGDGSPGAAAVPLLVQHTVEVVRWGTHEAVERRWVGDTGAGPPTVKRKVVNRVRVPRLVVFNTHAIPSVTRSKLPSFAARALHYWRHITVLAALVGARRRVVAVGDYNAPPTFRLLAPLRRVSQQVVTEPTHGRRVIDHAWVRGVRVVKVQVLDVPSDHNAVVLTVTT